MLELANLSSTEEKVNQIKELCLSWSTHKTATRNQLQKLTGRLLYVHRCVQPGSIFVKLNFESFRVSSNQRLHSFASSFFKTLLGSILSWISSMVL